MEGRSEQRLGSQSHGRLRRDDRSNGSRRRKNPGAIKKATLDKNTVVIFLSDNGGCAENLQRNWYDVPTRTRDGRDGQNRQCPQRVMAGDEDVWQSYGPPWANVSNTPYRLYKHWVHEGGIATP